MDYLAKRQGLNDSSLFIFVFLENLRGVTKIQASALKILVMQKITTFTSASQAGFNLKDCIFIFLSLRFHPSLRFMSQLILSRDANTGPSSLWHILQFLYIFILLA